MSSEHIGQTRSQDSAAEQSEQRTSEVIRRLDNLTRVVERVELRTEHVSTIEKALDRLERNLEKVADKNEKEAPTKNGWLSGVTAFLGVPALVVLMFLQLNQGREADRKAALSDAEILKTRTGELNERAELQKRLDDLEKARLENAKSYQDQLATFVPQLKASLARLDALAAESAKVHGTVLTRYLILWVFLFSLSLMFRSIGVIWQPLIFMLYRWSARFKYRGGERSGFVALARDLVLQILIPIPSVIQIAVEVALLVAVLVPMFDQIAATMGSHIRFDMVMSAFLSADFGGAVDLIRQVVG